MIRQLCYLSSAAPDFGADLERQFARAEARNAQSGITSLIAHGGGVIFQVLEGPRDCVAAVFARLCRDRRHHSIRLLQDEAVRHRDFEHWPLAVRALQPEMIEGLGGIVSAKAIPAIIAGISSPLSGMLRQRLAEAA